ncbi:MAG: trypsin-like peptidase domain-containing protein [Elusimicrobia bacterium]|nr:trypsin-like peptidase domain-containing protein [Elusimicrobiota bacterium]
MRKARAALALLLAFAVPVRAETTADPLWYLLSTYVLAPDAKAVEAQSDGPADSKGLAALQADLLVLTDGFEGFRDEAQVKETLERLKPRMSPELRPFFKDRASSLDAIYRTLAVTDYTWAQRFPEPPCEPGEARRKLLSSRDGLFQTEKGEASQWLSALLGPQAEGKSAEQALDQASFQAKLTGAGYEKLRARVRKLTMALASDKAVGAARSKLYCSRAAAFTDLAAAQRAKDAALISAGRVVAQKPEESVFVVVWKNQRAAATLLRTKNGVVLVTDAAIVADTDHPNLFAYSANAKPVPLTATVARRHPELNVAVLTVAEDPTRPALSLAETTPAKDELVTAIGHTMISGLWTKTSGLVTTVGEVSFQTDAAISPELSGAPVLNKAGEVAGILVLRPANTEEGRWPVAIPAPVLVRWLDDPAFAFPTAQAESIEDDGTAAVLSRARSIDLTEAGLGAWNIPGLPPPPSVPHGVCVQNCGGGSSSGSSYSSGYSGTGGEELGKALGELGAVLILKGIPALFRGIGKLFKKNNKSPSASVVKSSPSPKTKASPPPKPPPPPEPRCDLVMASSPKTIGGSPEDIVVRVTCDRPEAPLAGHKIKFEVQWDSGTARTAGTVDTGPTGEAILRLSVRNEATKRAAVVDRAEGSFGDLDQATAEHSEFEEEPAQAVAAPAGTFIEAGDGTRSLNTTPIEPTAIPEAPSTKPSRVAAVIATFTITGDVRRIVVTARLVKAARVARVASLAAAPETVGTTLGVTLATTVLLFIAQKQLEQVDCALKPGEDILDRFIDGRRLNRSGYLDFHEGKNLGHTLKKHVVQLHELQMRLSSRFPDVSSFEGQPMAEHVAREAVYRNLAFITNWGTHYTAEEREVPFIGIEKDIIGFGLTLDAPTTPDRRNHALIVLRQIAPPDCRIFILTAYPTRHAPKRIQE